MKIWPNRLFLDRLALPHMLTNFWMCFCGILSNFHGLRRTFPKSVLEFRFAICLKFGETLLLVARIWGKAPIRPFILCQPIGALPQIWGKWQNDVPVRLFSSFLQKSQSSCHCFDRHQLGFTNSILLNEILDICSRIYSLQIDLQCYLQSVPSVGINLNHDLEEGSYWSINFVLTNRSVSPNLRKMAKRNSITDLGNVLLKPWKLDRVPQKHIQKLVNICGRANLSRNSLFGHIFIDL